jgi:hypothetical protein
MRRLASKILASLGNPHQGIPDCCVQQDTNHTFRDPSRAQASSERLIVPYGAEVRQLRPNRGESKQVPVTINQNILEVEIWMHQNESGSVSGIGIQSKNSCRSFSSPLPYIVGGFSCLSRLE